MKFLITIAAITLASTCYAQKSRWGFDTRSKGMIEHQVREEAYERNQDLVDEAFVRQHYHTLLKESDEYLRKEDYHKALDKINEAFAVGYESPDAFFIRGYCLFTLEFYKEGLADLKKAAMAGNKDYYNFYLEAEKWLKESGIKLDK